MHKGDTCFMLKVGYGQTGIVARGTITSEPYSGEDWSWRNRPTKYCDFNFDTMINPDAYPILSSAELTKSIPGFDWNGGHSGVVLTGSQGEDLKCLWGDYMHRQAEYFEKASDQNLFHLYESASPADTPYSLELESDYSGRVICIKSKNGEVTTRIAISNYHRVLGMLGVKSWRALQQLIYQSYPNDSDLQNLCATLFRCRIDFRVDNYRNSGHEDEYEDN